MRLSPEQSQRVRDAAEGWAVRQGFGTSAEVPVQRALELIRDVAAETKIPVAKVRDALLAAAEAGNEAGRKAAASLDVGRPRADVRADRASGGGALSTLINARIESSRDGSAAVNGARSAIDVLKNVDHALTQTVKDFESTRIAITDRASPKVLNELAAAGAKLLGLFGQLKGDHTDKQLNEEIIKLYRDLLSTVAQDRGVFVVKSGEEASFDVEAKGADVGAGAAIAGGASVARDAKKLSAKTEKKLEELYDNVEKAALADGTPELDPRSPKVLGDVPGIAVDAATGRRFVYEFHGEVRSVMSIAELVSSRRELVKAEDARAQKLAADPKSLAELRSLTDKGLERLTGPVTWVSLSEDGGDQGLSRVYPTRWYKAPNSILHRRMISDGPFRGVFLDDLANKLAPKDRAFDYDPKHGASSPFAPQSGEPMVTTTKVKERGVAKDKLYVTIPYEKEWTEARNALRRLSVLDPSIVYDEGTKNTGFVFEPKNYGAVRNVLRGLALSDGAVSMLDKYFTDLTRVELAASDKSLVKHTAAAIGGFRKEVKGPDGRARPVQTTYWQRKALAWLEARDHKGVISLDTGMGKTLVAIGAMLELRSRQNVKEPFLIVCPPALRGNFPKEIYKFLEEKAAKELVDNLVILSYPQFTKAAKTGTLPDGSKFKPEKYGAIIFDEAQWLKSPTYGRTKAALAIKNPRKICLTASPMENSPMEAYVLACVANGINLNDRVEGKEHRRRMRKFKELYCETLGGRILGVKQKVQLMPKVTIDPKADLYTWVRSNLFFADKKMDDTKLPKLQLATETLSMPKEMELEYRKKSRRLVNIMRGMVSMYRDKGILREYVDDKGRTRREINPLARDKRIAQMFGVKFRGAIGELNEVTNNPQKIARAASLIWQRLEANPKNRTVLFSDSAKYVLETAQQLSAKIPGKVHAACLGTEIRLFQNGKELTKYGQFDLPFKQKEYRKNPDQPADGVANRDYPAAEWQQFVLNEIIGPDKEVATSTMFGPVYQQGQNLQWANTGIHLDRDTWNRENTKQREARLHRKGQTQEVQFYNLDWVYKKPKDVFDRTLDEIRQFHEAVGEDLFHQIIEVPQKEVQLGAEWETMRPASSLNIELEMLELGLVPTAKNAGAAGAHT
ncbi:DEAD/DEAH box helicase [Myxococcota bacterium]|nr:DEAD/DEAH box helicase [Myxococcota bacterium]